MNILKVDVASYGNEVSSVSLKTISNKGHLARFTDTLPEMCASCLVNYVAHQIDRFRPSGVEISGVGVHWAVIDKLTDMGYEVKEGKRDESS